MRLLKNCLAFLLILMISVITFYTWNLIFSFVSNYASLSRTSISGLPMIMFMIEIYISLFAIYNYIVLNRKDAFFFRKYSLLIGSFALAGFIFSILVGTYVYHSFVKDYIFFAYPLIMLIVHTSLLGVSAYVSITSISAIKKQNLKKEWQNERHYWIRELLIAFMLMFALNKLGGIVLLPMYWSSYDSSYVIPFLIQLLIPIFIFCVYMVDRQWKHNKKLTIKLLLIALIYSLCSLIYMLIIAHNNYPTIVNPLSPIMQFERLVTKPIGAIVLYGFSILYPGITIIVNLIKIRKEKTK